MILEIMVACMVNDGQSFPGPSKVLKFMYCIYSVDLFSFIFIHIWPTNATIYQPLPAKSKLLWSGTILGYWKMP